MQGVSTWEAVDLWAPQSTAGIFLRVRRPQARPPQTSYCCPSPPLSPKEHAYSVVCLPTVPLLQGLQDKPGCTGF